MHPHAVDVPTPSGGGASSAVDVLRQAQLLADRLRQEAEAEAAWQRGELSPLKCLMYRYRLDEPALAQITGLFQWRIRRHFRPAVYRRLSASILARYADAFGLPVEQLIGYQKATA